ncbi:MAG: bifunctional folylpolyglutamate synthase/dihydrofolate synthase [Candidatus Nanoarchaeia archaeon]
MKNTYPYINKLLTTTHIGERSSIEFVKEHLSIYAPKYDSYFKVIHVTGTAGKGSTATMIAKGLEESGYRVGLFTSPHLLSVSERIQVNSKSIDECVLEEYLLKFYTMYPNILFSEILILVAIEYFKDVNVDFVVFEVFVGGRLDPTNIFSSVATIITSIGLDHQHILGNNEDEILYQKLGITRKNTPLFTPIHSDFIVNYCINHGVEYRYVSREVSTNLKGSFQRRNAAVAYEVLKYLGVDEESIIQSLNSVTIKGRMQFIQQNILLDCAHNEIALQELKEFIEDYKKKYQYENENISKYVLVFALSKQKNLQDFEFLFEVFDEIILTQAQIFKSQDLKLSIEHLKSHSVEKITYFEHSKQVYEHLRNPEFNDAFICISGSVFIVSEFLELYSK